jgi:NAD(P)-dependent dehydrogenase (short-subunit alcohol dehydrogenase family)
MDLGLNGKVAIITGGSEGIGKAAAQVLAAEGAKVVIAARRPEVLEAAAEEIRAAGGEALAIPTDVTSAAEIERLVTGTVERFGRLDIVVNNAGAGAARPFLTIDDQAWIDDLDLKLLAAIRVTRVALPHLRAVGGGRVINITTIGGKQPGAHSGPSSISRAAGIALTKSLSKEFAPENILVNTVCIGVIKSAQQDRAAARGDRSLDQIHAEIGRGVPMGRIGETVEAANVIAFLASSMASYVTGVSINVDGGSSGVT